MCAPTVIATDLDGTLLDGSGRLSLRNQKALMAARERGHLVVAVTARPPRSVELVPELPGVLDAAICVNGSMLLDPATGVSRLLHHIPVPVARRLCEALQSVLPGASFAVETGAEVVAESRHFRDVVVGPERWAFVESSAELFELARTVVELKVMDPRARAVHMIEAARKVSVPEVVMWSWGGYPLIEFNAAGVDKGHALAAWCRDRGLGPESVIAFGDMPNDLAMLAWAHRSYAVANAQPELLGVATHRTASNEEDGVARVLEEILAE